MGAAEKAALSASDGRQTDSGAEVIAADNGRDFESAGDSEGHIALKNNRQKIKIMCGGFLTVTPNEGGGIVATVTLPDSAAQ